jgi:putative membrane protein (TIGR04086 family)
VDLRGLSCKFLFQNMGELFMTDRIVKAVMKSGIFAASSSIVISLIMTTLLYFELVEAATSSKILYGSFIIILLITSFVAARIVSSRGLLVGLVIAGVTILFSAMYRFIGVESTLGLAFLIRSAITVLVACVGAVVGVNTSK